VSDYFDPPYDDAGIPSSPFYPDHYGMNMHSIDQLSVDDIEKSLSYAGEWIRINVGTDEVADENWDYRLKPGLDKIHEAAGNLGIEAKVIINMTGYSENNSGGEYLLDGLGWDEKAHRYEDLAYTLASAVHSWGYTSTIFESWNEPDHEDPTKGIGLTPDDPGFVDALSGLNNGFAAGIKRAHGHTAFSPFMTFNDDKFDDILSVWERTQAGFDYFSVHMYDDDPGEARYWAEKLSDFLANRPVLVTEHGYQHDRRNTEKYRMQAWGFYQGFEYNGQSTLAGVMGYVYGSDHSGWVIDPNEDFLWNITHDSRP
jgi:hypothetical protein